MNIINLTPHSVNLPIGEIPPSGEIARVSVTLADSGSFAGISLVTGSYGQVTGLPETADGVLYIVSAMVRVACPDRKDLGSPSGLVRDASGNITGCVALEVNS